MFFPAPFQSSQENPLGLPLSVRKLPAQEVKEELLLPLALSPLPPKKYFSYGIFTHDGCQVATLERGLDRVLADRMIESINCAGQLRTDWNFNCIEQIPHIAYYAEKFLQCFRSFNRLDDYEIRSLQRRLTQPIVGGWIEQTEAFLRAIKVCSDTPIEIMLKGKFSHAHFGKNGEMERKASRIICTLPNAAKGQTAFIVLGTERQPSAQKLYGEILASTMQAFLDLNPENPLLPHHFIHMVRALKVAVPIIIERIKTDRCQASVVALRHPTIQAIYDFGCKLIESLNIFDDNSKTNAALLQHPNDISVVCEIHRQRMIEIQTLFQSLRNVEEPAIPTPQNGLLAGAYNA